MRFHALWITAIMLGVAGCGQQDQPEAQQAESPAATAAEAEAPEAAASAAEVKQAIAVHPAIAFR